MASRLPEGMLTREEEASNVEQAVSSPARQVELEEGVVPSLPSRTAAGRVWLWSFVAVMVAIPIGGMFAAERPGAFSWHMYSGPEMLETYEVERDGHREVVDLDAWVAHHRAERRSRRGLPEHICVSDPTVDAVWVDLRHLTQEEASSRTRWPCDR